MVLEVQDLCKCFDDYYAVNHMSFTLDKGVYGLLGANGAGKTTLMRMLCNLITPTSGKVLYNGTEIHELAENYRNVIGYLPQEVGFYPEFTAEDYLLYIAALKGIKPVFAKERTKELLELVSLTKYRKKKVKTFSGGMKRRLGIAQAVLNEPEILILDEPTAGLDPKERIRFRMLLSHLAQDRIVLLSTHIVSDIESIAKKIMIMKEGQMIASGDVKQLLTEIEHKVWSCLVSQTDAEQIQAEHLISNIKDVNGKFALRVISDEKPDKGATKEQPSLEDLFMYYFGEVSDYAALEV